MILPQHNMRFGHRAASIHLPKTFESMFDAGELLGIQIHFGYTKNGSPLAGHNSDVFHFKPQTKNITRWETHDLETIDNLFPESKQADIIRQGLLEWFAKGMRQKNAQWAFPRHKGFKNDSQIEQHTNTLTILGPDAVCLGATDLYQPLPENDVSLALWKGLEDWQHDPKQNTLPDFRNSDCKTHWDGLGVLTINGRLPQNAHDKMTLKKRLNTVWNNLKTIDHTIRTLSESGLFGFDISNSLDKVHEDDLF